MPKLSESLLRRALLATALVNLGGALTALLLPGLFGQLFYGRPLPADAYLWRYHLMFWGFVGVMGLAYALAAQNPFQEKALLLAGGLGKLVAASIFADMVWHGLGTWLLAGGGLWDASFGLLMLLALVQAKRPQTPSAS